MASNNALEGFKKIDVTSNYIVEAPKDYEEITFVKMFKFDDSLSKGLSCEVVKVAGFEQLASTDKPEPGKKYEAEFFRAERDFKKSEVIDFMKFQKALSFGFPGLCFAYSLSPVDRSGKRIWGVDIPILSLDFNNSYQGGCEMLLEGQDRRVEIIGLIYNGEGYLRFETIEKRHHPREVAKGSVITIFKLAA